MNSIALNRWAPLTVKSHTAITLLETYGWTRDSEWWTHPELSRAYKLQEAFDILCQKLIADTAERALSDEKP